MTNSIVLYLASAALFFGPADETQRHHTPGPAAALPQPTSLKEYWEDVFRRSLDHAVVGYSYAVYRHGEPVAVGGHGYARAPVSPNDPGIRMSEDTRMQIASCSKPITAVAVLHAFETKGLPLDTSIGSILRGKFPELGEGVDKITVKQLLTHTSGYEFGYINSPRLENTAKLLASPIANPPGEKHRYSNINTSLVRAVLEILTGSDYETYVRRELLVLAGAQNMKLNVHDSEVSYSYTYIGGRENGRPITDDFRDEAAAYGWYATANELARVVRAMRTGTYLSAEGTKRMFDEGLGWVKRKTYAGPSYGHDGQWISDGQIGVRTGIAIYPDDVEIVLLVNTNGPFFPRVIINDGVERCFPRVITAVVQNEGVAEVHISIPPAADEVRWTSDGSEPSLTSSLLSGPIKLSVPATVRCRGFTAGHPITFVNTVNLKREGN